MFRELSIAVCVVCVISVLFVGCSEKPYGTPEAALRSYVKAYNEGDKQGMAKCGNDAEMHKILTTTEEGLLGNPVRVPVKDIDFKVLSVTQKPRSTISNYYLTEDAWVRAEFRSRKNPKFHKVVTVRLVNRSHSFYMEEPHWQLVPVRGE